MKTHRIDLSNEEIPGTRGAGANHGEPINLPQHRNAGIQLEQHSITTQQTLSRSTITHQSIPKQERRIPSHIVPIPMLGSTELPRRLCLLRQHDHTSRPRPHRQRFLLWRDLWRGVRDSLVRPPLPLAHPVTSGLGGECPCDTSGRPHINSSQELISLARAVVERPWVLGGCAGARGTHLRSPLATGPSCRRLWAAARSLPVSGHPPQSPVRLREVEQSEKEQGGAHHFPPDIISVISLLNPCAP